MTIDHKGSLTMLLAATGLFLSFAVSAFDAGSSRSTPVVANANVRALFTPGDDVAGNIANVIRHARRQVLVQAFSFTHDDIARALLEAHRRGVDVRLIADREQTENMERGQVPGLARAGLPVWLDGEHQSAHNKVMVIDAGTPGAVIITGSFNFTRAAQYKNAENAVFISGNDTLVMEYVRNWQRHLAHSQPLTVH
jgi:phosphatidylserine/phosphatidylglycerophosphate/cardiolipin synthase-like enzyme